MSLDKTKRQLKRTVDSLAVKKQVRICKINAATINEPLGTFRKRKALNCGRPRCPSCCNPRRLWGHLTIPELRANESYRYALENV